MLTELGVKPAVVVPRIATEKSGIEAATRLHCALLVRRIALRRGHPLPR
jgi:hypothetical protein